MSDSLLGVRPLPKLGGCSRCARPAGTLAAEKYVLAGGAGQNMILSFSAGCGRRNSARRALPGEGHWTERWVRAFGFFAGCRPDLLGVPCRASPLDGRIGYPKGGFPTPKAFPSGGRCPSAHTGADEGAILYPTFPCRKEGDSRLSPQRNFSSAPLGNPVAPSSVTFGDSFPPRGSLWGVEPYPKKRPKSGHVHGHRNSPSTGTLRPTTQKPASGNERALKKGGRGASPRDSLRPGFL